MLHYETGFILSTVLIILLVLTMLVVSSADMVIIQHRMSNNFKQTAQLFTQTENCLYRVAATLANNSAITTSCINSTYTVENVASDPCQRVQGHTEPGVIYYRVTATSNDDHILQMIYAKFSKDTGICPDGKYSTDWIAAGQQSWLEIR